ncbi:TRAP transporter substrate-binding protein [Cereibacter azotoformans]|uniref:TRAP dicarboxylate transporter-DctP subunit n=1 Tax=Cereibacter sphaeroides (strain ATCC 17025 / ATH 2.4.3) TaxID=349102 RepID=A4WSS3_CERS5|nr:TRAP transporter substrate-binding protein [Cereibacter azotoformans]ULB09738.1 TRAP transporter substrate-binding protein [Cereibacter azotoformans]
MKTWKLCATALMLVLAPIGMAQAQVVLKLASNAVRSDPPRVGDQIAFEWLQSELESRTNGEVTLEIYWGGALGAEAQLVQSLETGVIDILPNSGSNAASTLPEAGLFSTSYLFRDFDHYRAVANDPAFFDRLAELQAARNAGYRLVGLGATGSRNLYNRTRPVATPEEAAGLKMRVQSSPIEFRIWQTLGLIPTAIPSTEIYLSLQTGVVDASESSIPFIMSNKYYEVAPYITLTNHQISTHLYFLNDASLQRVPEEHRQVLLGLLRETGNRHIDATADLSETMLEELRAQPGVTVTEADTKAFANRLVELQDEAAAELGVTDLLATIRAH